MSAMDIGPAQRWGMVMVDPISGTLGSVTRLGAAVAPAAPAAPPTPVRQQVAAETPEAPRALAQAMAAEPPIDADRVARIKKAIADGTFPILPSKIADRLLALKLQWNPNDQA